MESLSHVVSVGHEGAGLVPPAVGRQSSLSDQFYNERFLSSGAADVPAVRQ